MPDVGGTLPVEQPTYQRQGNSRLVSVSARANSEDFGGGVARAEAGLSGDLDQVAQAVQSADDKRTALWVQQASTQAQVDWQQKFANSREQLATDPSQGSGFVDNFKNQFNDYTKTISAGAPSEKATAMLTGKFNEIGLNLFGEAVSMQAKANVDWSIQSYQTSLQNLVKGANDPSNSVWLDKEGNVQSSFDSWRQQLSTLFKTSTGIVPSAHVQSGMQNTNIELDKAEIDTATNSLGAIKTAQLLQAGQLGKSLSIPQRQQQFLELMRQGRMDAELAHKDAVDGLEHLGSQVENNLPISQADATAAITAYANASKFKDTAMVEAGKYLDMQRQKGAAERTLQDITASTQISKQDAEGNLQVSAGRLEAGTQTYADSTGDLEAFARSRMERGSSNPLTAVKSYQQYYDQGKQLLDNAQETSVIRQQLMTMTPQEATAYVTKLAESKGPTNPVVQRVVDFEKQRQSLIIPQSPNYDPVSFTATDAKVSQALQLAQGSLQIALQPGANVQAKKDISDGIDATYAMQRQMGVPENQLLPISKQQALGLSGMIMDGARVNGQKAIDTIDSIKTAYGSHAGEVFNAITKLTPNGQGLSTSLQILAGLPASAPFRKDFAESLSTDLEKHPSKEEDDKAITKVLSVDPNLGSYKAALLATGASQSSVQTQVDAIQNSLSNYAHTLDYKKSFGVSSPDSAATMASSHVLGSLYGFATSNGQSMAIPRANGQGGIRSDDEIKTINGNLNLSKEDLFNQAKAGTFNFDLRGALSNMPHNLNQDENKKVALDNLKDNSYWATGIQGLTKSNEAVLMQIDPNTNKRAPVYTDKGEPVVKTFDNTPIRSWIGYGKDVIQALGVP